MIKLTNNKKNGEQKLSTNTWLQTKTHKMFDWIKYQYKP